MTQAPYKKSKLGLDGFDAVIYLAHHKQVPGKPEFKTKYKGMTYCFSSKENVDLFDIDPDKFLPQFEGHCAFAYALHGTLETGWPTYSNVVGDRLYYYSNPYYATICRLVPAFLNWAQSRYNRISTRLGPVAE